MIEFKILSCPDKSQQSTYQHIESSLSLGRTEGDMLIEDPALAPLQIKIYPKDGAFVVENMAKATEVRLNGKAFTGFVPIKEKDSLTIGRTSIQFTRLDQSAPRPPDAYQYPHAAARFVEGGKEKSILDALEYLESITPEAGAPPPGSTATESPAATSAGGASAGLGSSAPPLTGFGGLAGGLAASLGIPGFFSKKDAAPKPPTPTPPKPPLPGKK